MPFVPKVLKDDFSYIFIVHTYSEGAQSYQIKDWIERMTKKILDVTGSGPFRRDMQDEFIMISVYMFIKVL
ncbi:Nucleic-acid-binding protein from transposon X-element [Dirofilaria immitis]